MTEVTTDPTLVLIAGMASLRGERVIIIPPAQGGWEVQVGCDRSCPQSDLLTALHVAARRLGMPEVPRIPRCACGAVQHLEFGQLRCRRCSGGSVGHGEEGGDG